MRWKLWLSLAVAALLVWGAAYSCSPSKKTIVAKAPVSVTRTVAKPVVKIAVKHKANSKPYVCTSRQAEAGECLPLIKVHPDCPYKGILGLPPLPCP